MKHETAQVERAHTLNVTDADAQVEIAESVITSNPQPLITSQQPDATAYGELARRKKRRRIFIAALASSFIAASVGIAFYLNNSKSTAKGAPSAAMPAQTVTAVPAKLQPIDDILTVTGSVSAWDPLNIGAEVSGLRITDVKVEEGDRVKKGQVLAVINSALLRAQLDEAKARLASAEASLKKAIQPNRVEQILALRASLAQSEADITQQEALRRQAQVKLANAQLNAKRYADLATMGATSAQEAESRELAMQTASDELATAEAKIRASKSLTEQNKHKLQEAEHGGRVEDVQISRATIAQTKAQIANLIEQINQTIIRSPDDGIVAKRAAHLGEISSTGSPMFSLIRLNKLQLRAQVPDIDLNKISIGKKVAISIKEDDPSTVTGTVDLISPQVDTASRIGDVRINLPPNSKLKPGMFVRGEIDLGRHVALTVPPQAVVKRNGEAFVFKLNGKFADSQPVKVGSETDNYVEILQGLKPGETVIAAGARFLSDHDIVRVSQ